MKARSPVAHFLRQLAPSQTQTFALPLKDRSGPLACDRLLRLMPGKRAAFYGHYGSSEVIAKLFFKRGRHRQLCKRELDGLLALTDCGCDTPPLLYTGTTSDNAVTVLLLAWLPGAQSLVARWPELKGDEQRQELLSAVANVLARQHLGGVWQADLHLGNFLWHDGRVVCIDGDEVHQQKGPLDREAGFENFAVFCSQLPPRWDHLLAAAFLHYQRQRFGETLLSWAEYSPLVQRHRYQRFSLMLKKAKRSTTWLLHKNLRGAYAILQRTWDNEASRQFCEDPDTIVDGARQRIKEGNSSTLVRMDWPDGPVVIKRYNIKSTWQRIRRIFRESRAARSFQFAHALRLFEIDTPLPIIQLVRQNGLLKSEAYYVSAAIDGESLKAYLSGNTPLNAEQLQVIDRVLDLFAELHSLQLVHGDTKATNILIRDGKPVLLDLDAIKLVAGKRRHRRLFGKDMDRLLKNFAEQPDRLQAVLDGLQARGLR